MRVLLVEDSAPFRARLATALLGVPRISIVAESGSVGDALAALQREPVDLVLLDLSLPDGSGFAVLQAARERTPAVRVAVLTNLASAQFRQMSLAAGADAFFDKSDDLAGLLEWIARAA